MEGWGRVAGYNMIDGDFNTPDVNSAPNERSFVSLDLHSPLESPITILLCLCERTGHAIITGQLYTHGGHAGQAVPAEGGM